MLFAASARRAAGRGAVAQGSKIAFPFGANCQPALARFGRAQPGQPDAGRETRRHGRGSAPSARLSSRPAAVCTGTARAAGGGVR